MFIISFPSSGQNLMHRLLRHIYNYFDLSYSYCEFYGCCQHVPCLHHKLFQKNHDFGLNLNINDNEPFFILYRTNKITQLEAYFRYYYLKKYPNIEINYNNNDIFNHLIQFINKHSTYYDNFIKKYIDTLQFKNALIIDYDKFINNHKNYIKKIILYLNLSIQPSRIDIDVQNIVDSFEKIEFKHNLNLLIYRKIKNHLLNKNKK